MTPEEQVRRADRANVFVKDELFNDAVKKLRDEAIDKFKSAQTNEEFLKARALYDVTENFLNFFLNVVRNGEFAQRKIDEAKKKQKLPVHAFR